MKSTFDTSRLMTRSSRVSVMNYSRRPTLNRAIANSGQDKYENVFAFGGEWIPAFLLTKANLLAGG